MFLDLIVYIVSAAAILGGLTLIICELIDPQDY